MHCSQCQARKQKYSTVIYRFVTLHWAWNFIVCFNKPWAPFHMTIMLNNETLSKHLIHKVSLMCPFSTLDKSTFWNPLSRVNPSASPQEILTTETLKVFLGGFMSVPVLLWYGNTRFNLSWKWNYYPENELFITYHFPFLLINLATFLPKWSWIVRDMYRFLVVCAWT